MRAAMQDNPGRKAFTDLGTAATIDLTQAFGGLPTRNFLEGQFEQYENLNGNTIKETRMVANKACFACTIACGRVTRLGEHSGKYLVNMHPRNWKPAGEGPEYENAWALGADCGVGDLDAVLKANWLCNDLGLDPISMGASLAAAMELYERGVIGDDRGRDAVAVRLGRSARADGRGHRPIARASATKSPRARSGWARSSCTRKCSWA